MDEKEYLHKIEEKDLMLEVYSEVVEELRVLSKVSLGEYTKMWTHYLKSKLTEVKNNENNN